MKCRHCCSELNQIFIDLGFAPPSNSYLTEEDLEKPEIYYPLRVMVCEQCWLVQTQDYAEANVFFNAEYAYFSSTSKSWVNHAKKYVDQITQSLKLDENSFVIEVASNDGYLLKNFVDRGIPCLGIEPTSSTADEAEKFRIPVLREFFGEKLGNTIANQDKLADLIIGNNVYAHVPDINDFTKGMKNVLKPNGIITLEFPHLMRLIEYNQFDTIYHEHFSYLSLITVCRIFEKFGLRVWNVEELTTHGGSLRVYGCHDDNFRETDESVFNLLELEIERGMKTMEHYAQFQIQADRIKNEFLEFLLEQKKKGKMVVAYGAAAKGNTLLNYAGVKLDLLSFVYDAAEAKQNKYMPGSHIPILSPEAILESKPDYIVILPWNIADEVKTQLSTKLLGVKYVTVIPELSII